jgi:tetratricopeptide (TPR) repeat protein
VEHTPEMTRPRLLILLETALLIALTLWCGWRSVHDPFHFDDALFLQSAQVTEPVGPFLVFQPARGRQLTYQTFYWNYRIGASNPFGYHLVNLLIHLANVLGVYLLAALLIVPAPDTPARRVWPWIPMAAAAIFAAHPVQSEAVNYVYQRSTLLAAFFSLLSMNAWLLCRRAKRPWIFRVAAIASFILAVASKESALVLPAVWVVYVWAYAGDWRSFRQSISASWRTWVAVAAAMILSLGWMLIGLRLSGDRTIGLPMTPEALRYLGRQTQVFATYLRMLVWPAGLSVDHDFRAAPFLSLYSILSIALLAVVLMGIIRLRRRNPTPCFLASAFLILLAPTSSFVPSADLLFEHRLYLPMIPGAVLVAWGAISLLSAWKTTARVRQAAWIAGIVLALTPLALLFRHRTWIWGDNVRLWQDAASKAPWNARAQYNLGVSLLGRDVEEAGAAFAKAVALKPGYAAALYDLGWLAQKAGRAERAGEYYRKALEADPLYWQAHQNLGNLYLIRGNLPDAIREYGAVIRLRTDYWPAYQSLAAAQVQSGDFKESIGTLETLQRLQPDSLEAQYLRAYVFVAEGRIAEAESELDSLARKDKDGAYRVRAEELRAWIRGGQSPVSLNVRKRH